MKKFSILILLCFCFSCNEQIGDILDKGYLLGLSNPEDFERPSVLTISPFTGTRDVSLDSTISILFSRPMNRNATELAISISSNGGNITSSFNWRNDYLLDLSFKLGLTIGKRYEIKINRAIAKDTKNNTLTKDFVSDFYTLGFIDPPEIINAEPVISNSLVENWSVNQDILLYFSQPMDEAETSAATTISGGPAVFLKEWSNNSTVLRLRLQSPLQSSTSYTVRVSSSAKSKLGVPIIKEFSNSFYTGTVATALTFQVTPFPNSPAWPIVSPSPVLNEFVQISKFDSFRFTFNRPMKQETVERAISFSPSISGRYRWATGEILEFTPNSPLSQNTRYRLNFSSSAQDSNSIPLGNSYLIDFISNNSNDSMPITINSVTGYSISASCIPTLDSNPNAISYPFDQNKIYSISITSTDCSLMDYMFEISFNTAGGCALKTNGDGDIFNQISFSYFSGGPGGGSPLVYYKDYAPPALCSSPGVYKIGIKSLFPNVQYKNTILGGSAGLRDINENYLNSSESFLFQRL